MVFKKVSEKCHFELISGNFHEVLPDFLVFWKFDSNVLTEIKYSDNAIVFYTENYILSQIFMKGTQKMPALVPHPTVMPENEFCVYENKVQISCSYFGCCELECK